MFFSKIFAPTFAMEVYTRLQTACPNADALSAIHDRKSNGCYVQGLWPLKAHEENGTTFALIGVQVSENWIDAPPTVTAFDEFIRREKDWHSSPKGCLCYVLAQEWRDRLRKHFSKNDGDMELLINFAVTWLLSATDSLITRHLLGRRYGITEWPPEWRAYAHGNAGVEEYLRENKQR